MQLVVLTVCMTIVRDFFVYVYNGIQFSLMITAFDLTFFAASI